MSCESCDQRRKALEEAMEAMRSIKRKAEHILRQSVDVNIQETAEVVSSMEDEVVRCSDGI